MPTDNDDDHWDLGIGAPTTTQERDLAVLLLRAHVAAALGNPFMDDERKTYEPVTIDGHFNLGSSLKRSIRYCERVSG